ncbi:hypothetical protein LINPERHAP2_LOCUS9162 [Linum perenne]
MDDYVCFIQLMKIGTEILRYESIKRMWFVPPGGTLGIDLWEIKNDADAEKVHLAAKGSVINLYMEATMDTSFMADNEDSDSGNGHGYATSDLEAEVSGVRADQGVNHLIDDSDRTSGP